MTKERKRVAHLPPSLEARWEGTSGRHTTRVKNLSLIGCTLEDSGTVVNREVLKVELKMPGGEWLVLHGEVVFRIPDGSFGVYFAGLKGEARESIARLIEHYAGS